MDLELRIWQRQAFEFVKNHKTCIIQAATGTGKTRLAVSILDYLYIKHPNIKTLIIVPKNVILEKTWFKTLSNHFSLRDVGLYYGEVKEISKITITNIQSIDKLDVSSFDVIIADELHNMMSDRLQSYLKKPMLYKIGLTATLKRRDHKHWDLLEIFKFNLFNYTLDQGVQDKVLSKYNFHNVPISLTSQEQSEYEKIQNKIAQINFTMKQYSGNTIWSPEQKYSIYDERKKILSNSPKKINVLDNLLPYLKGKKVILFNEYNSISTPIFWHLTNLGFRPCIFNTVISKKVRMKNLDDYGKGKFDIIITTRALDEGYDLPEIDAAVILSGGSASRQMIQRVGRVLRKTDKIKDIYQVYFKDTIEEEIALKRYELIKNSCNMYEIMEI